MRCPRAIRGIHDHSVKRTSDTVQVADNPLLQPLSFKNEAEALAQLRPQIDGVVFKYGRYRSTFLPQVWEQLTDATTFMTHLKHKAGLHPEFWHDDVELYRYTVTKFKEKDHQPERRNNAESLAS